MGGQISWGLDRHHGQHRHAYDAGTGLTLCTAQPFTPVPPEDLREHERFLPNCRSCRVQAWERTNPGIIYPSPY